MQPDAYREPKLPIWELERTSFEQIQTRMKNWLKLRESGLGFSSLDEPGNDELAEAHLIPALFYYRGRSEKTKLSCLY